MKILILSIVDPWKSAHNRLFQFLKYLKKNHAITIISINDWWKASQTSLYSKRLEFSNFFEGIETKYITKYRISPILQETMSFTSFVEKKWVKRLNQEFDLIINYNTLAMGFYYSYVQCPMIFDIADDLVGMVRDSPQIIYPMRVLGTMLARFFIKQNIQRSSLISVSARILQSSYRLPQEKTLFIPNGVDFEFFKYDPTSINFRERLGLTNDFVLGYVGVLREWVDFLPVFKAIKKLNNEKNRKRRVRIVIVGKEGDQLATQRLARYLEITKDVIFLGEVPYQKVPKYISMFNVGLIPFKQNPITKNALPLKLFEYAACGKPVISTPIPEVKRIMKNRIFYASSSEEYYSIIKVQDQENLDLNNNQTELRNFIRGRYDWKRISKDYEREIIVKLFES